MTSQTGFFKLRIGLFVHAVFAVIFFIVRLISYQLNSETESQVLNAQYEKMRDVGIPTFESQLITGEPFVFDENTLSTENKNHTLVQKKIYIINFWASWCGPCVDEFPSMIKLVKYFNGSVGIIAVSLDSNKTEMMDFLKIFNAQEEKNFTFLWDPEFKVAQTFGTHKLPESYIVTQDLKLIKKIAGSIDWMDTNMINFLKEFISDR